MADKLGKSIGRRDFLKGSVAVAAVGMLEKTASADEKKPNIILINCDDLGYGDLGCYGSKTIATPNLDEMARKGTRFTDFYAAAAVCSPSRAALLTGRYPIRTGVTRVLFPDDTIGLTDKETTVAQLLKQQGYTTACIGKWHVGCLPEHMPRRHGFDYFYGLPYSNDMFAGKRNSPPVPLYRNEKIIEQPVVQETLTERYTEEAIKFLRKNKDKPFFIYLPHTMPHVPLHVSEKFKGKSKGGLYGDVVETIDWGVGEILKALKEEGLEDNTLVMFTSDNGPWLQMKENGGSAGPLRGGKASVFEGGMREPFIAYWPGHVPSGKVCKEPASMLDMLPTLTALAGGKAPIDRIIDGRDITPLLTGAGNMPDYPFFYNLKFPTGAVRYGKWKLHVTRGNEPLAEPELYDLENDIGETNNVAKDHPDIIEKLTAMVKKAGAEPK